MGFIPGPNKTCKKCGETKPRSASITIMPLEKSGLLCNLCNVGLGAFKDNREALLKAANYLK